MTRTTSWGFNYDIWENIATFLTNKDLWELRHLNSSLFVLAMKRKFNAVDLPINLQQIKRQAHDFSVLRDPVIAIRVRQLRLVNKSLRIYPYRQSWSRKLFSHLKQRVLFRDDYPVRSMMKTVSQFTNVSSMVIMLPSLLSESSDVFLHFCVRRMAGNLRSLTLEAFLSVPHLIPDSVFMPQLEEVKLSARKDGNFTSLNTDSIFGKLLQFVNRHKKSIRSLTLDFTFRPWLGETPSDVNFNLNPLYEGLDVFPTLECVDLTVSSQVNTSVISRVLHRHSQTLRRLHLIVTSDLTVVAADRILENITTSLRFLDSLIVSYSVRMHRLRERSDGYHALEDYSFAKSISTIVRHSPNVTSLEIKSPWYHHFLLPMVIPLFDLSSAWKMPSRLNFFSIKLDCINVATIDLIYSCLPNLDRLEICVIDFIRRFHAGNKRDQEFEFCVEIGQRSYADWKLRHIIFQQFYAENWGYGLTAVAEALPNVHSFNRMPRSLYLEKATRRFDLPSHRERLPWELHQDYRTG